MLSFQIERIKQNLRQNHEGDSDTPRAGFQLENQAFLSQETYISQKFQIFRNNVTFCRGLSSRQCRAFLINACRILGKFNVAAVKK